MTIHFHPHGETFDLYDNSGEEIASDVPFSGTWSPPDPPQEVLDELKDLAENYYAANGMDGYLLSNLADVWFNQIEEGTPPE